MRDRVNSRRGNYKQRLFIELYTYKQRGEVKVFAILTNRYIASITIPKRQTKVDKGCGGVDSASDIQLFVCPLYVQYSSI